MKKQYISPRIKKKKIKINLFTGKSRNYQNDNIMDGLLLAYNCLAPGTKIMMSDSTTKRVETIKIGDSVLSYNFVNKVVTINTVKNIMINKSQDGGQYYLINDYLQITGDHVIWEVNQGWIKVDELKVGNTLYRNIKDEIKKENVTKINKILGDENSYNLELTNTEFNYFAEGILVHNASMCVSPDTEILLPDKKSKPIKQVKIGDKVLSYDEKNKTVISNKVKVVIVHENENEDGYFLINNKLRITGNHQIWTENKGWIYVDKVEPKDVLLTLDKGSISMVNVSSIEKKEGEKTVYNIELTNDPHSYFADGILIHNCKR